MCAAILLPFLDLRVGVQRPAALFPPILERHQPIGPDPPQRSGTGGDRSDGLADGQIGNALPFCRLEFFHLAMQSHVCAGAAIADVRAMLGEPG
jgi:hypothetical protein